MKKGSFIFVLFLALFLGCTGQDDYILTEEKERSENANPEIRTVEEAMAIVRNADAQFFPVKSRSSRSISRDVMVIGSPVKTRGSQDTLLYVVNFDNDGGYALVAADRQVTPLLAICDQGNYMGAGSVNPGAEVAIDRAINYSLERRDSTREELAFQIIEIDTLADYTVEPRVKVRFGQKWPYGYYCPNGLCGCAVTAASQIMSYYETPTVISLTYPNADKTSVTLDWKDIKKHIGNSERCFSGCGAKSESHYDLARLCRQLGYDSQTQYLDGLSSTYVDKVPRLFVRTSLKCGEAYEYIEKQSVFKIKDDGIFYMGGFKENSLNGHAWIIDGYRHFKERYAYYIGYPERLTKIGAGMYKEFVKEEILELVYPHVNWGWDGDSNGYYYDGIFNTNRIYELDSGCGAISGMSYDYNLGYRLVSE